VSPNLVSEAWHTGLHQRSKQRNDFQGAVPACVLAICSRRQLAMVVEQEFVRGEHADVEGLARRTGR
jgi:hypothetical protein